MGSSYSATDHTSNTNSLSRLKLTHRRLTALGKLGSIFKHRNLVLGVYYLPRAALPTSAFGLLGLFINTDDPLSYISIIIPSIFLFTSLVIKHGKIYAQKIYNIKLINSFGASFICRFILFNVLLYLIYFVVGFIYGFVDGLLELNTMRYFYSFLFSPFSINLLYILWLGSSGYISHKAFLISFERLYCP